MMTRKDLTPQQIRDFINRVKLQAPEMIAEGINEEELTTRIYALEDALNGDKPKADIAKRLDELEGTLTAASSGLSSAGVLNFLNGRAAGLNTKGCVDPLTQTGQNKKQSPYHPGKISRPSGAGISGVRL
ncbi:MAG: hypothetical protein V4691_05145 [Pseudomonadota bacterium]